MDSMNVDNAREMEQRKQAMRETNRAPERALLFIAGACVWHEPANEIINLDSNRHFFDSLAQDEECMRFFFPDVDQDVLFNSGHAEDASASVTSQDDTFGLTDVLGQRLVEPAIGYGQELVLRISHADHLAQPG